MSRLDRIYAFEWWVRQDVRAEAAEEGEDREYSCEDGMSTWRQDCHDTLRRHIRDELCKARDRILAADD